MVQEAELDDYSSLEDFIALARQGKKLKAEVSIRISKPCPTREVPPSSKEKLIVESYMLIRDYVFKGEIDEKLISKTSLLGYFFGTEEESFHANKMICQAANEYLKYDYRCLREAEVQFEEAFIEC
jgi:hypothetical protein